MSEHEHDEGLAPVEWVLLVPTAAIWMVNGLAGFLLFSIFVGYAVYRQNPDAFAGLLDTPAQMLPSRTGRGRKPIRERAPNDDDALLHSLLDDGQADDEHKRQAAPALAVVPWRQWRVQAVKAHHLLVIGNTDSGKTTLVRALLTGKRGAIIVLDPKNRPGKWGGIEAIGLDDQAEYTRIEHALRHVLHELRQRQQALNNGADAFTPLTVVVDEAPDVADECPTFPPVFKRVGSLGRELQISLIVLSQRSTVKPLGISGDGQARDNFTRILMGSFARRAVPALEGQRHCAVLDAEGERRVLETWPLPAYAKLPIRAGVVSGVAMGDTSDDTTDTRYQAGMAREVGGIGPDTRGDGDHTTPDTSCDTRADTSFDTTPDDGITPEQIRAWYAAGVSKKRIKERLRGSGQQRQERLNRALGQHAEQERDDDDPPPPAFGFLSE